MSTPYGGRFSEAARYMAAGRAAVHVKGNSLATPAMDYLWADSFPRALGSRKRLHYMTVTGQNAAAQCLHNNLGLATFDSATAIDNGGARTELRYEKPAATSLTDNIMWPCRPQVGNAVLADGDAFGTGIYLSRQIAYDVAHTNAQRASPWPTNPSNAGQPWYHNSDMSAKLIHWRATEGADNLTGFKIRMIRQGVGTGSAVNEVASTGASFVSHTVAAGADRIEATAFATALADAGTYCSDANGIPNDHDVGIRVFGNGATTNAKIFIPLAALFARMESAVVPSNSDGTRFSYFAGGRSGCYVTDWLNYCTETQWADWYAATILETNPILVQLYDLVHNVNTGAAIGVSPADAFGDDNEYDSTPTHQVNDCWRGRFKAIIERDRTAFLASHPTGIFCPVIVVSHPVKGTCAMDVDDQDLITSINDSCKSVAASVTGGCGWVSLAEYFRGTSATWLPVFQNVHPWTPENGRVLAAAMMECIDHATGGEYSPLGMSSGLSRPRNRN